MPFFVRRGKSIPGINIAGARIYIYLVRRAKFPQSAEAQLNFHAHFQRKACGYSRENLEAQLHRLQNIPRFRRHSRQGVPALQTHRRQVPFPHEDAWRGWQGCHAVQNLRSLQLRLRHSRSALKILLYGINVRCETGYILQ